jgi:hypothetical protein
MKILFLIISLLSTFASANNEHRNVFVFLDQHDVSENIGNPGSYFLSSKLQSALHEKAAPIIINASLWNAFIEKRTSIQQMSTVSKSPEQKALDLYNKISEQLTYWIKSYSEKADPLQAKQLAVEKINEEYYKKKNEKEEFVDPNVTHALIARLTRFDKNEWDAYTNQKSFYLLVPKNYVEHLAQTSLQFSNNKALSAREQLLGFKIDHLTQIPNIEDPATCYFDAKAIDKHLPAHLYDFFVTKKDLENNEMPYQWNILLFGHGGSYYKEITTDKTRSTAVAIIADLTPEEMHTFLEFCDKDIKTNCFYYKTCHGGGNHIKMVFDDYGNPTYNYTIISGCLSDGYAHSFAQDIPFPNASKKMLAMDEIEYDKNTQQWHLICKQNYKWKKFLKKIMTNSFDKDISWLAKILPSITRNFLCDQPIIRLAGSSKFTPISTDRIITLNDTALELRRNGNLKEINCSQAYLLIDSKHVAIPVILEHPTNIVSIAPGHATHYFEKIECKSNKDIHKMFNPLEGNTKYHKHFLIDEFTFPNNKESPFDKLFKSEGDQIIAKNVLVHVQYDRLIRIFAQIVNKGYMITINRTDYDGNNTQVKGITPMSDEICKRYLKKYEQLKQEIIGQPSQQSANA